MVSLIHYSLENKVGRFEGGFAIGSVGVAKCFLLQPWLQYFPGNGGQSCGPYTVMVLIEVLIFIYS